MYRFIERNLSVYYRLGLLIAFNTYEVEIDIQYFMFNFFIVNYKLLTK